jgi:protein TonB
MKTNVKNFDDIVFEKRNQDYGAYYLRKSYNKNVTRALIISVVLFLGLVTILIAGMDNSNRGFGGGGEFVMDSTLITPPEKQELPKLPELPVSDKRISFTVPKPVKGDSIEEYADIFGLMESTTNETISETGDGGLLVDDGKDKEVINQDIIEKPIFAPDVSPCFIGGEEAMYKWLADNIKYPQIARETTIKGVVMVTFVVEKDGSITGVSLLNDIGGGCGDEALRVVKLMPKWREGRQAGVPVRAQFNLPIRFVLE